MPDLRALLQALTPNVPLPEGLNTATGTVGIDGAGDVLVYQPPDVIEYLGGGAGGPFLPLSGGQMQGPLYWTSTGTTQSRSAQDRTAEIFDVQDFGAKGDGVTDDTAAVQAALNRAVSLGGIVTIGRLRCLLNSSINVPVGVTLRGDYGNPGITPLAPAALAPNYYTMPCQIMLGAGATINLASSCALEGLIITRAGLAMAPPDVAAALALVASYNGTAIAASGADIGMHDLLLLGHTQGIFSNWDSPTAPQTGGRCIIERVRGDCTNGILITNSYDIASISDCHFWPFLTVLPGTETNNAWARSGIAFDAQDAEWCRYIRCFGYGYQTTYRALNAKSTSYTSCDADGSQSGEVVNNWLVSGTSDPVLLIGCTGNSATVSLLVNQDQTAVPTELPTSVRTTSCRFAAVACCVRVAQGSYYSTNDTLESGDGAAPYMAGGISAASGTSGAIVATTFRWVAGGGYWFADAATAANWDVIAPHFTGETAIPSVVNQFSNPLNVGLLNATAVDANTLQAAGSVTLSTPGAASGSYRIATTTNPTDENIWDWLVSGNTFAFRMINDAYTAANNWLSVGRNGYTVTSINFGGEVFAGLSGTDLVVGRQTATPLTATGGFLVVPYCNGQPTGVPANNVLGVPLVFDITTDRLLAYANGAWRSVTLS